MTNVRQSTTRLTTLSAIARFGCFGLALLLSSCQSPQSSLPPRDLIVKQDWELKPGQSVAGYRISGGLGDISVEVRGKSVYAPFPGVLQAYQSHLDCAIFASPQIPAYLLRLCGLRRPKFGELEEGELMGTGRTLQFAALRKQPTGEWAIVEPASDIVERVLSRP